MLSGQDVPALSAEPMTLDADRVAFGQIDLLAVPAEVKAQIKYAILDPSSWNTHGYVALLRLVEALAGVGLDAAWAEAEAATRIGPDWGGPSVYRFDPKPGDPEGPYGAKASPPGDDGTQSIYAYGDTPAAALHALAAELRRRHE